MIKNSSVTTKKYLQLEWIVKLKNIEFIWYQLNKATLNVMLKSCFKNELDKNHQAKLKLFDWEETIILYHHFNT